MTEKSITVKWFAMVVLLSPFFLFAQTQSVELTRAGAGSKDISQETHNQNMSREVDEEDWIHYDDSENEDAWGFLISGEEYDIVAKWDPENISDFDGWSITKIKFIVVNDGPIYKVKVWEGPNTTEIYSQDVESVNENAWTEVILDTPVTIDASQELWVGYHVDFTSSEFGGFVTATDAGPPVDEYGNLFRWNGDWYSEYNNHNLQVYIELALDSEFEADITDLCEGSTVNFSDLSENANSWLWTFEGGTPSTSTEQNPSVVYNTPGSYDVSLEVTYGNETDTEEKTGYINVYELPAQSGIPEGETETCSNQFYIYEIEEVPYAQSYEWVIEPIDAGYFYWQDNVATLESASDWSGDFTIKVKAINICGDGEWSDELECNMSISPEQYDLEGGGIYCFEGEGVEITLNDSDDGIEYELFLEGETTGIIVDGTGDEISFGFLIEEGTYTAVGSNGSCNIDMNNQVNVTIEFPPTEPATPVGPVVVCNSTSSDYESEGTVDADEYVWVLSPENAGDIIFDNLMATVNWNTDFSGEAEVALYGINDCGDGNLCQSLVVYVEADPFPEIAGPDIVCDNHFEDYSVQENDGSNYTWEVTGGTITGGQGTYTITVEWGEPGDGIVTVIEETENGCLGSSEEFVVLIDDCTDIGENNHDKNLTVFPNPAEHGYINIVSGSTGNFDIQIINSTGIVVLETKAINSSTQINISELPNGLYFVKTSGYSNHHLVKFFRR